MGSPNSAARITSRVTLPVRLGRGVAGFFLGWIWCSIVCLTWPLGLVAGYGSLDRGLEEFHGEWWAHIAFAGYAGAMLGSITGSTAGPAFVGPSRHRSPVFITSLTGAGLGALISAAVGAIVGWQIWEEAPRSKPALLVPLALGLPLGILAGWLAGSRYTHPSPETPVAGETLEEW